MAHIERIIAELSTLDEAQQARLLALVEQVKAERAAAGVRQLRSIVGPAPC